jgi:Xaa-Pro aminopeptidase
VDKCAATICSWFEEVSNRGAHASSGFDYLAFFDRFDPFAGYHYDFHFILSPAYLLNLSGSDFPFNMLFKAYLFVSQQSAVLFVDVSDDTGTALYLYLQLLGVERRDYNDVWQFLRQTEWGIGKVCYFLCDSLKT